VPSMEKQVSPVDESEPPRRGQSALSVHIRGIASATLVLFGLLLTIIWGGTIVLTVFYLL
jgi:hypothetical protein